jgi:hypothetical protein
MSNCKWTVFQKSIYPRTSPEDVKVLKDLDGTLLQYILSTETPTVSTPLGEVQIGSFLSYQVNIYDLYTYVLVVLSVTKVS